MFYKEYDFGPSVRVLSHSIGQSLGVEWGNLDRLYGLFRHGSARQANRYAGLPKSSAEGWSGR